MNPALKSLSQMKSNRFIDVVLWAFNIHIFQEHCKKKKTAAFDEPSAEWRRQSGTEKKKQKARGGEKCLLAGAGSAVWGIKTSCQVDDLGQ